MDQLEHSQIDRPSGALFIALVIFLLCAPTYATDEQRIIVKLRASTDSGGRRSSRSYTIITTVGEVTPDKLKLGKGNIDLVVLDVRDGEFSVRVDLVDADGSVIDSEAILTSEKEATFSFSSEQVSVNGSLSIKRLE